MLKKYFLPFLLLAGVAIIAPPAPAAVVISSSTQVMLEAMQKVLHHDFRGAEQLYGQAIAIDPSNSDAWLQRALMRRELGDAAGTASDARQVVMLSNQRLATHPNDPDLYYHRGMGYRYLRDYPNAERDIAKAIQMGGPEGWKTDLEATDLEAKEGQ